MMCFQGGNWEVINLPEGFELGSMNNSRDIVGSKREDGLSRPWILKHGGKWQWLPYVADHNTGPSFIADDGTIVGGAASDHGGHAIAWRQV